MSTSLAQSAIAVLIDLAERGEIDPWDVQVIEVIDRVLAELASRITPDPSGYEANLSQSGQVFLYASMLILLKAERLAALESQADVDEPEVLECFDSNSFSGVERLTNLETYLRRRASAPPPARRRVTLQELIDQLNLMAAAMEARPAPVRSPRPKPQSRRQALRAISQLAHQENLAEVAIALEQFLDYCWSNLAASEEGLAFEQLVEHWTAFASALPAPTPAPPHNGHDRVGAFWALLLLSAQSRVELSQEEFYGDLWVYPCRTADEQGIPQVSSLS
ncbi:segregation/condensation protein A [Trichothermofontia sichuanensis B231]|uniref:segregation/condensation protein A n=1 Tax=Trichothermofontia sichuanensis TaxID=3045816 RepID=UPI0022473042|nr:ScpA family protein [Trichothermofontia sichuanensis]UZQ54743.1 segregation/condensation protein A [Trichothermofontia sichuanensis B231]